MDPSSYLTTILLNDSLFSLGFILPAIGMIVLLAASALVSGSEVAFFAIKQPQLDELKEAGDKNSLRVVDLLSIPDHENGPKNLLACILVLNNFINIIIILLSTAVMSKLFPAGTFDQAWLEVFINIFVVTFLIVLFGEVIPKVYATNYGINLAKIMALPISISQRFFWVLWKPLVSLGNLIDNRFKQTNGASVSLEELEHALELTDSEERTDEEKKIYDGIINFGSIDVKQVMTSRLDIKSFSIETPFENLCLEIVNTGFSRLPIYEESIDKISGMLYIKDLLPYLGQDNFEWQKLVRSSFYVPENKKIDDLLREFQEKKIHMAIVVDEYGGTSGLVTLEDIIEEIVGEITDEFDEEDLQFSRLDEDNFIFEGKTALIDIYRILDIEGDSLEEAKGESDTLAGFIIEQSGKIPQKGEKIIFENLTFLIDAADKRKVKRIKVSVDREKTNEED